MKASSAFLWGCVGAAAPEVIRLYKYAQSGTPFPAINWGYFYFFLGLYVFFGGLVAIAWKPEHSWKALWVGASLPSIIAGLVQAAPALTSK
jgi:hypothetical protein